MVVIFIALFVEFHSGDSAKMDFACNSYSDLLNALQEKVVTDTKFYGSTYLKIINLLDVSPVYLTSFDLVCFCFCI